MRVTDQFCPTGPYHVIVKEWTPEQLLARRLESPSLPIPIEQFSQGFSTPSLVRAYYWRGWLSELLDVGSQDRTSDDHPVRIEPELYRPEPYQRLRGYEGQFLDLSRAIEEAVRECQDASGLVQQANDVLARWETDAAALQAQVQLWLEALEQEKPPRPEDEEDRAARRVYEEARAVYELARDNINLIQRQASSDTTFVIGRWHGVAEEIARTGRFPDFD